MTNYLLPESDRMAADLNPVLTEVATMTEEAANHLEIGAITVIGLVGESLSDLRDKAIAEAVSAGFLATDASDPFDQIADALFGILQPRVNALRDAVRVAQGVPEQPDVEALLNGLLIAMLGEDVAAAVLAEADEDEAEFWDSYDEEEDFGFDEDVEEEETTPEQELEDFLAALFGRV